jgi:hypothetical protein
MKHQAICTRRNGAQWNSSGKTGEKAIIMVTNPREPHNISCLQPPSRKLHAHKKTHTTPKCPIFTCTLHVFSVFCLHICHLIPYIAHRPSEIHMLRSPLPSFLTLLRHFKPSYIRISSPLPSFQPFVTSYIRIPGIS